MQLLTRLLSLLVLFGVLLVGMLFALQNTATVPLDLLFLQLSARSVALWVLLAFGVGAILGMLASSGVVLRLRKDLFTTRSELQRKAAEVDKLRAGERKVK